MFMHTDDIVNTVRKGDSGLDKASPRDQWEAPGGADVYGHEWEGKSLRQKKTADLLHGGSHHHKFYGRDWDTAPPVTLWHPRNYESTHGPELAEGHHRLAWAQMHGYQWMAVEHDLPTPEEVKRRQEHSDVMRAIRERPEESYPPIKVVRLSTGGTIRTDHYIR